MKKIIALILILLAMTNVKSQDFHLSMYDAAPLFLNSSLTGVVDAKWRIHSHYRTQWSSVNFKPYTTALLSFDIPYKKWGFGGQVINSRAGAGNYNGLQALFSAAYTLPIDQPKNHNVSFGMQAGITQKTVEHPLLTFDNQYTPSNGGSFNSSLGTGETFTGQSIAQPNANAGILYYFSKQQSKLNPFIGTSVFNLLQPKETLLDEANNLPLRYYLHAGTRINLSELIYLLPKVLVMRQENFMQETYSMDAGFYIKWAETYLLGGLIYRNNDAFVPSIGLKKESYIAKISYDFNTSSLSSASGSRGGFEISFTYMKLNKKPKDKKICPRL